MTADDLIHQFALFVARVSDNPQTTELEWDALLLALNQLDEIAASAI
ncbi:hypothetical protein [Frigoribacterium sp. PhB24]|nr:hypothetical protein [Frigoribacterium sp. PhB24]